MSSNIESKTTALSVCSNMSSFFTSTDKEKQCLPLGKYNNFINLDETVWWINISDGKEKWKGKRERWEVTWNQM